MNRLKEILENPKGHSYTTGDILNNEDICEALLEMSIYNALDQPAKKAFKLLTEILEHHTRATT